MEDRWFTINVTNALAPTDGTAASNTLYAATPDCELPECDPEFSKLFLFYFYMHMYRTKQSDLCLLILLLLNSQSIFAGVPI